MPALQRALNILFICVLCGALIGSFIYQFALDAPPCPLCLLQRISIIGIAIGLLMNLRFGIRVEHYGLSILSCLVRRTISLRQISLHVCHQLPNLKEPILGYDLFVWAFLIFTCSIFAIAVLLICLGFSKNETKKIPWGIWENFAFYLVVAITLTNIVITLKECGLSSCT